MKNWIVILFNGISKGTKLMEYYRQETTMIVDFVIYAIL